MKFYIFIMPIFLFLQGVLFADDLNDSITQAAALHAKKKTAEAAEIMQQAVDANPESSVANAYLGYYQGLLSGQTENYIKAGELVQSAFRYLDHAVALDTACVESRLFRGTLGVNVPGFFGKTEQAIVDLEWLFKFHQNDPGHLSREQIGQACQMLVKGYEATDRPGKAESVRKLIQKEPEKQKSSRQSGPEQGAVKYTEEPLKQANQYYKDKKYSHARKILETFIQQHPDHPDAVMLMLQVLSEWADVGYENSIREDTDERAKLAIDVMTWMDRAVALDPGNMALRLERNTLGIQLPFFVEKLDPCLQDLKEMLQSDLPDSVNAEIFFLLGQGYRQKQLKCWSNAIAKYPREKMIHEIKTASHPPIVKTDFSALQKPVVVVDFILGYQDQLAPQTALWVETEKGEYVRTLYVSGFSGHVKAKQVVLPQWASASGFSGLDGVTAASIDWGEHIYQWNLHDLDGKRVPAGSYRICLEVTYWPSMAYEKTDLMIDIQKNDAHMIQEKGDCISFLEGQFLK